jgi:hypothetical protein
VKLQAQQVTTKYAHHKSYRREEQEKHKTGYDGVRDFANKVA